MHLFYSVSPASVRQDILIPYWLLHAKVLRKNTSFQISPICLALENFDDRVNQIGHSESIPFRRLFTTVDQTTKKYAFQAFSTFHLPHYKCPERHFHNEIPEIDILIPDRVFRHFNSSSNPRAPNLFQSYKGTRHLACFDTFRPELCHEISSSPATYVPKGRFISNHPIQSSS